MGKHTPGPWWVDHKTPGGGNIQSANGPVADARFFGNTHSEEMADYANARLIAAAPDLMEALDMLLYPEKYLVNVATARERAQNAIAKALGES